MSDLVLANKFTPLPAQDAFRRSNATVRGFGGA